MNTNSLARQGEDLPEIRNWKWEFSSPQEQI